MDNRDRGRMSNWFSSEQGNKGNQQQSSRGAPSKRYVVVKSQKETVTVTSHQSADQTLLPPPHFQHYPVQDAPQFTQYGHTPNRPHHQQGGNQQHGQFSNNYKNNNNYNNNNNNYNNNNNNYNNNNNFHKNNNYNNRNDYQQNQQKKRNRFPEHLTPEELEAGLKNGTLHRGELRINPHNSRHSYVTLEHLDRDALIDGPRGRNRAYDGDTVVMRLDPEDTWKAEKNDDDSPADEDEELVVFKPVAAPTPDLPIPSKVDKHQDNVDSTDSSKIENVENDKKADQEDQSLGDELPEKEEAKPTKRILGNLRPTGVVVGILATKRPTEIAGYILPCNNNSNLEAKEEASWNDQVAFFTPFDKKIPRLLINPKREKVRLFSDDPTLTDRSVHENIFVSHIYDWTAQTSNPRGKILRSLGKAGSVEVEIKAVLSDCGIHWTDQFDEQVIASIVPPGSTFSISDAELSVRRDLRNEPGVRVFTIDPATAKDLDDAISIKDLDDAHYEVGVHIADVTHFLKPGSPADVEAAKRATTVYLVDRSIPMLPRIMCDNLCSLVPDEDRLTFSVFWKITKDTFQIVDESFHKSVIRSCAKLSYGDAQALIDGLPLPSTTTTTTTEESTSTSTSTSTTSTTSTSSSEEKEKVLEQIKGDILKLQEIAKRWRTKRYDNGALSLDQTSYYFVLNDDKFPIDVKPYVMKDSNKLIEELMLQANMSVGRKIFHTYPTGSLLRNHSPPNPRKLEELQRFCKKTGIQLDSSTSTAFMHSLLILEAATNQERKEIEELGLDAALQGKLRRASDVELVMKTLSTKPMSTAKYIGTDPVTCTSEDYYHYALAVPEYTHFTSPIRRYADVMVHRVLYAAITSTSLTHDGTSTKDGPITNERMKEIALICNERKRFADKASDGCEASYISLLLNTNTPLQDTEAIVMSMGEKSFTAIVPEYEMDKRIHIEDFPLLTKSEYTAHKDPDLESDDPAAVEGQKQKHTLHWANGQVSHIVPFSRVRVRLYPDVKRKPIQLQMMFIPPGFDGDIVDEYAKRRKVRETEKAQKEEEKKKKDTDELESQRAERTEVKKQKRRESPVKRTAARNQRKRTAKSASTKLNFSDDDDDDDDTSSGSQDDVDVDDLPPPPRNFKQPNRQQGQQGGNNQGQHQRPKSNQGQQGGANNQGGQQHNNNQGQQGGGNNPGGQRGKPTRGRGRGRGGQKKRGGPKPNDQPQ